MRACVNPSVNRCAVKIVGFIVANEVVVCQTMPVEGSLRTR